MTRDEQCIRRLTRWANPITLQNDFLARQAVTGEWLYDVVWHCSIGEISATAPTICEAVRQADELAEQAKEKI